MANPLDIAARLRASTDGTALRLGRVAPTMLADRPYVFVGLSLAGEDATLHAVRFGRLGEEPLIDTAITDPRDRTAQYELFAELGDVIFGVCEEAIATGEHPQIVVANGAAADHLAFLADRALHLRDSLDATDEERARTARVNLLGTYLSYFTSRLPIARQQALLSATRLLRAVYVTGESEGEEEHLGLLRAWIEPLPPAVDAFDYRARAATRPAATRTTVADDRVLIRRLAKITELGRGARPDAADEVESARADVAGILAATVAEIDASVRWAIAHLQSLELPAPIHVRDAHNDEVRTFASFMKSRDEGFHLKMHDSRKSAAVEFSYRTAEQQVYEVGALWYDPVERARAVLDGRVLRGRITLLDVAAGRMTVRSSQPSLRVRVGDRFYGTDETAYPVLAVALGDGALEVTLEIAPRIGGPALGESIDLLPNVLRADESLRSRQQAARRLAAAHWAYDRDEPIVAGPRFTQPPDVLAELARHHA